MKLADTMAALEAAGTEQNRKVYPRHGVRSPIFGVSLADLDKLRKQIKRDHALALELWRTGNHDARMLATLVADPAALSSGEIDAWMADCDNYLLTDALAKLVAASPHARAKVEGWIASKGEWTSSGGWTVIASLLVRQGETIPAEDLEGYLARIERHLTGAPNRTRYAMNNALIGIGCVSDELARHAVAAAKRIGPVEVDHGETGCKTPDAVSYIPKARAHYAAKAAKAGRVEGRTSRKGAGADARKRRGR